jgi:hypothetical protein
MAKGKLYHIGRTLRNRIAPRKAKPGRPLVSRKMTRMEAAFPTFPSLSARDSQNRLRRSFGFGVEFVFLKKPGVSPGPPVCKADDGYMLEMGATF